MQALWCTSVVLLYTPIRVILYSRADNMIHTNPNRMVQCVLVILFWQGRNRFSYHPKSWQKPENSETKYFTNQKTCFRAEDGSMQQLSDGSDIHVLRYQLRSSADTAAGWTADSADSFKSIYQNETVFGEESVRQIEQVSKNLVKWKGQCHEFFLLFF